MSGDLITGKGHATTATAAVPVPETVKRVEAIEAEVEYIPAKDVKEDLKAIGSKISLSKGTGDMMVEEVEDSFNKSSSSQMHNISYGYKAKWRK